MNRAITSFIFLTIEAVLCRDAWANPGVCDAVTVAALKTEYRLVQSSTLSDALFEAGCLSARRAGGNQLSFGVPGIGDVGYGQNNQSASSACYQNDRQFFVRNQYDLLISMLPDNVAEIIRACTGGLTFSARQTERTIEFTTHWYSRTDGEAITISGFDWSPRESMECKGPTFNRGQTVTPGGRSALCERIDPNATIVVRLDTDKAGAKTVRIFPKPDERFNPYRTTYDVIRRGNNTNVTQCRTHDGRMLGAEIDCRLDGSCNSPTLIMGFCIHRHGRGEVIVSNLPGGREITSPVIDRWGLDTSGTPTEHHYFCTANGQRIHEAPHDCRPEGLCSSQPRLIALCAARYSQR